MNQKIIRLLITVVILSITTGFSEGMKLQDGVTLPPGWRRLTRGITFEDINDPVKDSTLFVNHASKAAISFYNGARYISYICDINFIARGNAYKGNLGRPCRAALEMAYKPRLHSEISFLQHITEEDEPGTKIQGILEHMLSYHSSERIIIYIKNTTYPPCATQEDEKIPCREYLRLFRDKLGKKKCKIIVYAIGTRKIQTLDFNSDVWL